MILHILPSLGATFINKETVSIGLLSFFLQASLTYTSMLLWSFIGLWSHKKSGTKEQQKATCVPKMFLSALITKNCHVGIKIISILKVHLMARKLRHPT